LTFEIILFLCIEGATIHKRLTRKPKDLKELGNYFYTVQENIFQTSEVICLWLSSCCVLLNMDAYSVMRAGKFEFFILRE